MAGVLYLGPNSKTRGPARVNLVAGEGIEFPESTIITDTARSQHFPEFGSDVFHSYFTSVRAPSHPGIGIKSAIDRDYGSSDKI
jgi:hypothetical protein